MAPKLCIILICTLLSVRGIVQGETLVSDSGWSAGSMVAVRHLEAVDTLHAPAVLGEAVLFQEDSQAEAMPRREFTYRAQACPALLSLELVLGWCCPSARISHIMALNQLA